MFVVIPTGTPGLSGEGEGATQSPVTAQGVPLKSAKDRMDIISAYREVGTYRGAAEMCGTTHKTVRRVIERFEAGDTPPPRQPRPRNYDTVTEIVAERIASSRGRISAKRLLPIAAAAGYTGSDRNFRRLVADEKTKWRKNNHRGRRPAVWTPGEYLVIDWATLGAGLHLFCAVLAYSRWRFVAFATDERAGTTLTLIAEALAAIGGVPTKVLADFDGLPQRRSRGERGGPDPGLRADGHPLRVPSRLLPRRRPRIEGRRRTPRRLRPTRPGRPAAHRRRPVRPTGEPDHRERRREGLVHRAPDRSWAQASRTVSTTRSSSARSCAVAFGPNSSLICRSMSRTTESAASNASRPAVVTCSSCTCR